MGKLIDTKPKGGMIVGNKPYQSGMNTGISNRLITRSVDALSPIGLLLALTYTADETFTTEYNP